MKQIAKLLAVLVVSFGACTDKTVPEVVVYVAVDRAQSEPILKSFERQSGIRVRAIYDAEATKTTGLVARLLVEADRPRCDVFWNNELVQTLLLSKRGALAKYQPPAAADIPTEFKDPAGYWTGVAARARVIAYHAELVDRDQVPQTIADLADPRWRGKAAIADPQFGTTRTHVAALFANLGTADAQSLLESLLENDIQILDGNAMVKNRIARAVPGASPILVGLTDTDDVCAGRDEGFPIEMIYPDQQTMGTLVIPTTVCLIANGPNPRQAKQLVDFLVSEAAEQQLTVGNSGYFSLRGKGTDRLPKAIQIEHRALLDQLEPSSRWTAERFR